MTEKTNKFGLHYRIEDYDTMYNIDEVVKLLAELPITEKPAEADNMYDIIYLVAPDITGAQAKDIYKDLPESTFKRWGLYEEEETVTNEIKEKFQLTKKEEATT